MFMYTSGIIRTLETFWYTSGHTELLGDFGGVYIRFKSPIMREQAFDVDLCTVLLLGLAKGFLIRVK